MLVSLGADLGRVRQQVIQLMSGNQGKESVGANQGSSSGENPSGSPVLDQFGRNLTQLARDGKLDPVIGRAKEIERVMQVPVSYTHLDVYKRQVTDTAAPAQPAAV